MNTCKDVIDLLTEFMEGGLPPGEVRSIEDHLALCPACKEFLETLRKTSAAARNLRVDEVPEECHRELLALVGAELQKGRKPS
jgi:anti-sigma factor RsiW